MSKVKVFIDDGIITDVRSDDKSLEVEIVDFDSDNGEKELLEKEYEKEKELVTIDFNINHCVKGENT